MAIPMPREAIPSYKIWGEVGILACCAGSTMTSTVVHVRGPAPLHANVNKLVDGEMPENESDYGPQESSPVAIGTVVAQALAGAPGLERAGRGAAGVGTDPATFETQAASTLHELGACKPCLYMHSKAGCLNGSACKFCHQPHQKKSRQRPCKATRMQCKQLVSMLDAFALGPEQMEEVTEKLGARSSYMRSILKGKQKQVEDSPISTPPPFCPRPPGRSLPPSPPVKDPSVRIQPPPKGPPGFAILPPGASRLPGWVPAQDWDPRAGVVVSEVISL